MTDTNSNVVTLEERGGFTCVPNAIYMMGLSVKEIAIYCYLLCCEDRTDYTCYPTLRAIGKAVNLSRKTVWKYVHMLEEKKLIFIQHTHMNTKDGAVLNGTLLYHINPISWALNDYYERKLRESEAEQRRNNLRKKAKAKRLIS